MRLSILSYWIGISEGQVCIGKVLKRLGAGDMMVTGKTRFW